MKITETGLHKESRPFLPEVSIIVPVFNVAPYLQECIDSVLAQTYTDYELLVIDDGSTDDCGRIAEEYALADRRIRVIHKKNGGLSSARNAGLDAAVGKYVYFLDGDDRILPGLLETVVPEMRRGYGQVTFNYRVPGKTNSIHIRERREYLLETMEERYVFLRDVVYTGKFHWEAWNRIFSREIIETYHIRFENNKEIYAEDLCFFLYYLAHSGRFLAIPDVLYEYRMRENSLTKERIGQIMLPEFVELARRVRKYYAGFPKCAALTARSADLYYLLVRGSVLRLCDWREKGRRSFEEARQEVYRTVSDWQEFRDTIRCVYRDGKALRILLANFGPLNTRREICFVKALFLEPSPKRAVFCCLAGLFGFLRRVRRSVFRNWKRKEQV